MKSFPRVGVIGSGQLAQMTLAPAAALGIDFVSLANSSDDSAAQSSPHVVGDFRDLDTVRNFAKGCDIVTFEHELIPISIVRTLESEGIKFFPTSNSFQYSQDKALMREKLAHLPNPKWQVVTEAIDWEYPAIAKAISGGYDGRGVWKIESKVDLEKLLKEVPKLILEELINFDFEITLLTVRAVGVSGQVQTFFCDAIGHKQVAGDYVESWKPQAMSDIALAKARDIADKVTTNLGGRGIFGVELFVKGDEVWFSEVSPRPHDTGLVTLASQYQSEFEIHARAILGLPVNTACHSVAASAVIYGGLEAQGIAFEGVAEALQVPNSDLRLFGKPESFAKRRMGVALCRAEDVDGARTNAREAAGRVKPVLGS